MQVTPDECARAVVPSCPRTIVADDDAAVCAVIQTISGAPADAVLSSTTAATWPDATAGNDDIHDVVNVVSDELSPVVNVPVTLFCRIRTRLTTTAQDPARAASPAVPCCAPCQVSRSPKAVPA